MRLLAVSLAVFALGAAPLPAASPSPAPLKEIASVRARAFCALSKKNAVDALTALAASEATLDSAFNRMKKANTSSSASMDLMVMNLQNHVHAALDNINKAEDLLKKLRESADMRDDKKSKDAALAVIATLERDRKLETELMNRVNDFAESYLMYALAAGNEDEQLMRSATGTTFGSGLHSPPPGANSLTVSALSTQLLDENRRETMLQSLFTGMTSQTLDLGKASMGDLHDATLDAYGATEALIAVCNK